MSASGKKTSNTLISIIGDRETVTGFLLTGIGQKNAGGSYNFLIVEDDTTAAEIEETFD